MLDLDEGTTAIMNDETVPLLDLEDKRIGAIEWALVMVALPCELPSHHIAARVSSVFL